MGIETNHSNYPTDPQEGDLSVWWIPQVPMPSFMVSVESIHEAKKLLDVLAAYDQFQLDHNVKPDYCNVGGLSRWEPDGEGGFDWYDVDEEEMGS